MVNAQYRVRAHAPATRFRGPLLVMHGDRDPHLRGLRSVIVALRGAHPDLTVSVIPDSGHCAHEDNAAAFTAALASWLDPAREREAGAAAGEREASAAVHQSALQEPGAGRPAPGGLAAPAGDCKQPNQKR